MSVVWVIRKGSQVSGIYACWLLGRGSHVLICLWTRELVCSLYVFNYRFKCKMGRTCSFFSIVGTFHQRYLLKVYSSAFLLFHVCFIRNKDAKAEVNFCNINIARLFNFSFFKFLFYSLSYSCSSDGLILIERECRLIYIFMTNCSF